MSAPDSADGSGDAYRLAGLGDRATRLVETIVATVASLTDPGHPVDAALDSTFATTLDTYRDAAAIQATTERDDVRHAAARGTAEAALDGLDILAEAYTARAAGGPTSADLHDLLDTEIRELDGINRDVLLAERSYQSLPVSTSAQQALAAADATNFLTVAHATRDQLATISEATHAPVPVISTDADAREVAEHAAAGPFLMATGTATNRPAAARASQAPGVPVGRSQAAGAAVGIDPKGWAR